VLPQASSCVIVAHSPVGVGPGLRCGCVCGDSVLDISVDGADGVKYAVVSSADGPVHCFAGWAAGMGVVDGVMGAVDKRGRIQWRRQLELASRHGDLQS